MKILVTDDSKMARKMVIKTLQDALNDKNYEVLETQNGQESVDLYKEHNPNIVFMDLTMSVMDGFEALKQIKEFNENAKVVVISADIQKQAMDKVRELGALNFVKKPIDLKKMEQILNSINNCSRLFFHKI